MAASTSSLNPLDWYRAAFGILNQSLSPSELNHAANTLYDYVDQKSEGRLLSKKIRQDKLRYPMIERLFQKYTHGALSSELCQTGFMRRIVKHDRSNQAYLKFIEEQIVPVQISNLPGSEKLAQDATVRLWLRDLNATICDPAALEEQKQIYDSIPEPKYRELLSIGRAAIGKSFKEAILKGWIDAKEIDQIREKLLQKVEENQLVELTQETAVDYFVYRYRAVIATGEKYEEQFCDAIRKGLNRFKLKELEILKKAISKSDQ